MEKKIYSDIKGNIFIGDMISENQMIHPVDITNECYLAVANSMEIQRGKSLNSFKMGVGKGTLVWYPPEIND